MGTNVGSPSVLDTMRRKKVRAHIHGHIHKCFGREGIHFNVASADGSWKVQVNCFNANGPPTAAEG